jgi:hypothetical protein
MAIACLAEKAASTLDSAAQRFGTVRCVLAAGDSYHKLLFLSAE